MRAWLADLAASDVSASSATGRFRLLRRITNVAVQSEVIARSPCTGARPPPVPAHEMCSYPSEEVADQAEDVIAGTAAPSSRRLHRPPVGELAACKRGRLDLLQRSLNVTVQLTKLNRELRSPNPGPNPAAAG